jgi:HlyD family secretion protein
MKNRALLVLSMMILLTDCSKKMDARFIGSAVVEVRTYQVSAALQGQLVSVFKDEGDKVLAGELVALIDTVPLILKKMELRALIVQAEQQITSRKADISVAQTEVKGVKREFDRTSELVSKGSVPSQQKDNLETQYSVGQQRITAATIALNTINAQIDVLHAQGNTLQDQIRRCYIYSPGSGVVITRYRNGGEVAGPGAPLFEIGSIDTVQADFFVPQPLLSKISVGLAVNIRIDDSDSGNTGAMIPAVVTWISDQAEFSPKNIQTRDARNELVFRVRAKARNTGNLLKRGLPVEVWFVK